MKIRTILLIMLSIILIFGIGFFAYTQFYHEEITVGNVNLTLPSGFHKGTSNSINDTNITNGTHTLFIAMYDSNDINKYVNMYINSSKERNYTVSTSNFTIDSIEVTKAVNDQTGAEHFWFIKDDKVYSIYDWEKLNNIDNIIFDLIKSSEK